MSTMKNPFGAPGTRQNTRVRVDMETIFGRHGKGIAYWATLSFDPGVFEPGSGVELAPSVFSVVAVGFDQDDQEQIEAIGVSIAKWEREAIKKLAGFGAIDIWIEESATDEEAQWLEETGYLDDLVDMEMSAQEALGAERIAPVHA
jgi:hypothetical protein